MIVVLFVVARKIKHSIGSSFISKRNGYGDVELLESKERLFAGHLPKNSVLGKVLPVVNSLS